MDVDDIIEDIEGPITWLYYGWRLSSYLGVLMIFVNDETLSLMNSAGEDNAGLSYYMYALSWIPFAFSLSALLSVEPSTITC